MTAIMVDSERMRELLINADDEHTLLALQLMDLSKECTGDALAWDPDAHYTKLEIALARIAEALGFDYHEDIAKEAYRRRKEADL